MNARMKKKSKKPEAAICHGKQPPLLSPKTFNHAHAHRAHPNMHTPICRHTHTHIHTHMVTFKSGADVNVQVWR